MKQQVFLYIRILFLLFFIFILDISLVAAQEIKNEKTIQLRIALPFRVLDELTRKDAKFAMDMWSKEIVRSINKRTNIKFNVTNVFLENDYSQPNFAINMNYDILILGALEFYDFNFNKYWEPAALTASKGHFPEEYLVLAKKDRNFKDIQDLYKRDIALAKDNNERLILYWLNYFLRTKHLGNINNFFNTQQTVKNDSRAILLVFFNKIDACIVNYNQFQTMVELNPQIGRDLVIIKKSPPFARGMACIRKSFDGKIKQLIKSAILALPSYERGRQVLAFFGQSNLFPSQDKYLKSLRELVKSSKALAK